MFRALQSTSFRGERNRVEKGGEGIRERIREWRGQADGDGTRTGAGEGKAGASREGSRGRGEKGVRWSRMCQITGKSTRGTVPIRFGTYNIRNGCNGGLESALRRVSQANMDLGIFKEKRY